MNFTAPAAVAAFALTLGIADAAPPQETLVFPHYPNDTPWRAIAHNPSAGETRTEWHPRRDGFGFEDVVIARVIPARADADPVAFLRGELKTLAAGCTSARATAPLDLREYGTRVAYAQMDCHKWLSTKQEVEISLKAIAGRTALFVLQREFRSPPLYFPPPKLETLPKERRAIVEGLFRARDAANSFLFSQARLCPPGICRAEALRSAVTSRSILVFHDEKPQPRPDWPIDGETTAKDVRARLGTPMAENHADPQNRGQYVLYYEEASGTMCALLFDRQDTLTFTDIHIGPPPMPR